VGQQYRSSEKYKQETDGFCVDDDCSSRRIDGQHKTVHTNSVRNNGIISPAESSNDVIKHYLLPQSRSRICPARLHIMGYSYVLGPASGKLVSLRENPVIRKY
jgi:hypothetical protein